MKFKKMSPWERGAISSSGGELHYPSPNRRFDIYLKPEGDIRFGPCYFSMIVGGTALRQRIFGGEIIWARDSSIFAAQEWLSTEEREGPDTRLVLIDPKKKTQCIIERCKGGFISALRFYPESITYHCEVVDARTIRNVALDEILEWTPLIIPAAPLAWYKKAFNFLAGAAARKAK